MNVITIIAIGCAMLCNSVVLLLKISEIWGAKSLKILAAGWIVGFLTGFIIKTIT